MLRVFQSRLFTTSPETGVLNHDEYYVCDANIPIYYSSGGVEGLCSFVDEYFRNGKKLFIQPRFAAEMEHLPEPFEILRFEDRSHMVQVAVDSYDKQLGLVGKRWKEIVENDLPGLIESGWAQTNSEQIPTEALLNDKVFFLTTNMQMLRRLILVEDRVEALGKCIDLHGLEHLTPVKRLKLDGSTERLWL